MNGGELHVFPRLLKVCRDGGTELSVTSSSSVKYENCNNLGFYRH